MGQPFAKYAIPVGLVLFAGLALASVLLGAGSSSAPVREPTAAATVTTATAPSTTIDPQPAPTTTEPPPTTAPTIDVWMAPNGDDGNNGRSAASPVGSIRRVRELVSPGSSVWLLPGEYEPLRIEEWAGSAAQPISIAPLEPDSVVVRDLSFDRTAALWIENSEHVRVSGLELRHALWGVEVRASSNVVLEGNRIHEIGQEAIHIRSASNRVDVLGNSISDTGNRENYDLGGSGVYVGSSGGDDPVFGITIRQNDIFATASEAIDVKGGTWDILIEENLIHDISTLQSGAVVVHLLDQGPSFDPDIVIRRNQIWGITTGTRWADGNGIVVATSALIEGNLIHSNEHRGILVESALPTQFPAEITIRNNTIVDNGRVSIESRAPSAALLITDNIIDLPAGLTFLGEGNVDQQAADLADSFTPTGPAAVDSATGPTTTNEDVWGNDRVSGDSQDVGAVESATAEL